MWLLILECAVVKGRGAFAVSKVVFYVRFVSQQQLAARVSMTRFSALLSVKSEGLG